MIKAKQQKRWEVWTKADGTEISVGDMDEGHLRNALNLVLRRQRERAEKEFDKFIRKEIRYLNKPWWDGND